jgi:cytochrome c oxidase subunit 2
MTLPSRAVGNKRSKLWLSPVSGDLLFKQRNFNMDRLKMMLIALTILSAASATTSAQVANDAGKGTLAVHEIQMTLRKYEFSPGSLRVKRGELVKLIMTASDHDHGFKLDDFNIDQKIPKGATVVVEFTADKVGTFQFRCSNVCGIGHRGMKGTLVVEE